MLYAYWLNYINILSREYHTLNINYIINKDNFPLFFIY